MHIARLALAIPFFLVLCSPALSQELTLRGTSRTVTVCETQLRAMPRTSVEVEMHGRRHRFEGVRLSELLKPLDIPRGEFLRGAALTNVVIVHSRDDYTVVLALAETDASVRNGEVIIADRMDGRAMGDQDGPFRLVVEDDLKPARSARMVDSIEVRPLEAAR